MENVNNIQLQLNYWLIFLGNSLERLYLAIYILNQNLVKSIACKALVFILVDKYCHLRRSPPFVFFYISVFFGKSGVFSGICQLLSCLCI